VVLQDDIWGSFQGGKSRDKKGENAYCMGKAASEEKYQDGSKESPRNSEDSGEKHLKGKAYKFRGRLGGEDRLQRMGKKEKANAAMARRNTCC